MQSNFQRDDFLHKREGTDNASYVSYYSRGRSRIDLRSSHNGEQPEGFHPAKTEGRTGNRESNYGQRQNDFSQSSNQYGYSSSMSDSGYAQLYISQGCENTKKYKKLTDNLSSNKNVIATSVRQNHGGSGDGDNSSNVYDYPLEMHENVQINGQDHPSNEVNSRTRDTTRTGTSNTKYQEASKKYYNNHDRYTEIHAVEGNDIRGNVLSANNFGNSSRQIPPRTRYSQNHVNRYVYNNRDNSSSRGIQPNNERSCSRKKVCLIGLVIMMVTAAVIIPIVATRKGQHDGTSSTPKPFKAYVPVLTATDTPTTTTMDTPTNKTTDDTTATPTEAPSATTMNDNTTTSTDVPVTTETPEVRFLELNETLEIGSPDVAIACKAININGWSSVEIWFTPMSSTTVVLLLKKLRDIGASPQESLSNRASYTYTDISNSSITATISLNTVLCQDEGTFRCDLNTKSQHWTVKRSVKVKKTSQKPMLFLNPDQITDLNFHRRGNEHYCEAELGYPPGVLSVVFKQKDTRTFTSFNANRVLYYHSNVSRDCSIVYTLKFGLNFTSADEDGEIKCVLKNEKQSIELESDIKTLELVPKNICNDGSNAKYRYHPTACNKYVQCSSIDNLKYPYGKSCSSLDQCVLDIMTANCGSCDGAYCPVNFINVKCEGSTVFIGSQATIKCNITEDFDYINVTHSSEKVVGISSDGSVQVITPNSRRTVTFNNGVITVTVVNTTCLDKGNFIFSISQNTNTKTVYVILGLKAKPSTPTLILDPDILENFPRVVREHKCEGFVGYPGGFMIYQVKKPGNNTAYEIPVYNANDQTAVTEENCVNKVVMKFLLKLGIEYNDGYIRCVADNSNTMSGNEPEYASEPQTLEIIPENYCSGNWGENNKVFPGNRNKYVICEHTSPYGRTCNDKCFDKDDANQPCKDCNVLSSSFESTTNVKCEGSTVSFGSQSTIECNITEDFDYMNVSHSSEKVAYISSDGSVQVKTPNSRRTVTFNNGVITVTIVNTTCSDKGSYIFGIKHNTDIKSVYVMLVLKAKPSTPTLILDPDIVEYFPRLGREHKCEGFVGYPGGSMIYQVKKPGNNTAYEIPVYNANDQTAVTEENCVNKVVVKFLLKLGIEYNDGYIRCVADNSNTVSGNEPEYASEPQTLEIIPENICSGNWGEKNKVFPGNCNKYIVCEHTSVFGRTCNDKCFDKDDANQPCKDCNAVEC